MPSQTRTVRDPLAAWWGWVLVASTAVILSACSNPAASSLSGWTQPNDNAKVAALAPPREKIISISAQSPDQAFYAPPPGYAPQPGYAPAPGYAPVPAYAQPTGYAPAAGNPAMMPAGHRHAPAMPYGNPPCGPNGCYPPNAGYSAYAPYAPNGMTAGGFANPVVIDPNARYCPPDEYICDGGDTRNLVRVGKDWELYGLDQEDTVAHFDTLDGDTVVEKSNKVCIYSPRFAAVRSVTGLNLNAQVVGSRGAEETQRLNMSEERIPVIARVANTQLGRNISTDRAGGLINRQGLGLSAESLMPFQGTTEWKIHEDFSLIRFGVADLSEGPQLANAALAAIRWTANAGVQVAIDGERASEVVFDAKAQEVVKVHAVGKSKLQIVKTASKAAAGIGDEIDFTLRFDNVGDRPIGNVVIVDNLTTRLEYVDGSAQASCKLDYAKDENGEVKRTENGHPIWAQNPIRFFTQLNEGETLVLRWELQEPLAAGQGGIIRFKCRVR